MRVLSRRSLPRKATLLVILALSFSALLVWQTLKPSTGAPSDFATYAYQWATDDGTPTARVAVDDTPITIVSGGTSAKNPIVRLRWVMGDSSGAGLASASLKLQYTTDPTWATGVTDVGAQGTSATKFIYRNSASVTDGAAATAPITDSDGAIAGQVFESAAASSYNHPALRKFYEHDFSLQYIGTEGTATTYYFRTVINGTAIPFSAAHGSQGPSIHVEASGTPNNLSWENHGWKWFADAGACPTTELYTGRDPNTTTVTRDGVGSATPNLRLRWQFGTGSSLTGASVDVVYTTDPNWSWYTYVSDQGTTGGKWRYRDGVGTHGSAETCGSAKVSGHSWSTGGLWIEQLVTGWSVTGGTSKYYEHDVSLQYTGNETATYYLSYVVNGQLADMSGMHASQGAIINTTAALSPVSQSWRWVSDDASATDRSGADNTYITVQKNASGTLNPQVRLRHVIRDKSGAGWTARPLTYQYTTDDTWATGVAEVGAPGTTNRKWRFRNSSFVTNGNAAGTPKTTTNSPSAGKVLEQSSDTYAQTAGFTSYENDVSLEYIGDETADYYFRPVVGGTPVTFDATAGNQGPRIKTSQIPVDVAAPTTTLSTSPSPANGENGWFISAPTITLTSSESGSTGYRWDSTPNNSAYSVPFLYTAGEGTHTLYYQSTDDALNVETPNSQVFKLDTVAPTNPVLTSSTHQTSQASSNDQVTVNFGASSDASSGITGFSYLFDTNAATTPDTTTDAGITSAQSAALPDGTSHYFHLRSRDAAGNWSTTSHLGPFYIDQTAPSVSSSNPADAATGTGVSTNVTVTFSEDVSADTITSSTFNLKSSTNDTVAGALSYDAPSKTATLNPTTNLLYSQTYTGTVTTGVKDAAGNALSPAFSFSFTTGAAPDTTPPTTTLTKTPSSPDGDNGWYLSAPSLNLSANEATTDTQFQWDFTNGAWSSGNAPAPGEGDHTLYYRSIDTSNNTEDAKSAVIKLDSVDPTDPNTITSSHAEDARSSDQTIYMDWSGASDVSSGLDGYSFSFTSGATDVPDSSKDVEETVTEATSDSLADGVYYFHIRTHDNAGNWTSTEHYGPVTIDATEPVTTLTTDPLTPDGDNGWFTAAPTITLNSSESGSTGYRWDGASVNSAYSVPFLYTAGEGSHTLYYQSTDDVSNVESPLSQVFKLDTVAPTNPVLTSSTHQTSQESSNDQITVNFGASSDASSGITGFSYEFDTSAATVPDTTPEGGVTSAQSAALPDGTSHYFHLRSRDAAGNWSTTSHLGPFYIDQTAPSVSATSPVDTETDVGLAANVTVTFSEDISADTIVSSTFNLKSSTNDTVAGVLSYDSPTQTATLNPTTNLIAGETYTASVTTGVKDAAGNALSPAASFSFTTSVATDSTAPVTTLTKTPASPDGDNDWYYTIPTLDLSANEATVDTQYQWDSTTDAWSSGGTPVPSQGDKTLYYRSIDTSGNTEDAKSAAIKLDSVNPAEPDTLTSSHTEGGRSNDPTVHMDWSGASDATSGLDGYSYSFTAGATDTPDTSKEVEQDIAEATSDTLADGAWYFHIRGRDNAGNWGGTAHYGPVTVDTDAPATTLSTDPAAPDGDNSWFVTEPLITLSRDEAGNTKWSWDSLPVDQFWLGTWPYDGGQGSHTLYYHSTDDVGNVEMPENSQLFKVDTVSPDAITLGETSHTIGASSSDDTIEIRWLLPSDESSGVDGYAFEFMGHSDMDIDLTKDSEEGQRGATSDALVDGEWFFHIHTRDNAGNWSEGGHFGPYVIDTVSPDASLATSPVSPNGNGSWFTSTPDIILSMNESGHLDYQWDGTGDAGWQTYSVTFDAEQGEHTLYYRAVDDAGQTSDIGSQAFFVDTSPPSVAITSPANGSTVNGSGTTIDGTASDSGASGFDKAQVRVNGGSWVDATGTSTWNYRWTHTTDAAYTINARSLDLAGNASTLGTATLTVDNTPPTVTSTSPANSATEIAITSNVAVTFSEAVSPDTITGSTFTMVDSTNDAVAGTVSWDSGTRTATLNPTSTLNNGTEYTATISTGVKDSVGNPIASPYVFSFTTVSAFDVHPPGAPGQVWSHVFSGTQGKLYWAAATDDVGVTSYEVYDESSSLVGTTTATYYDLPVLTPGNTYEFRVKAADEAGNKSSYSETVSVRAAYVDTTPAGPDTHSTTVAPVTGYSVTFTDVTADGTTSVDEIPSPPTAPSGFSFIGAAVDIQTTAGIDGDIVVGISFSGGGVVDETDLRMFHYENGEWVNITSHVDTEENIVFGTASSLSPFVIGSPSSGGGWWKESTADPLGSSDWQSQVGNTDFGSPHGGFSTTSNLCKTCHAVHNSMPGSYRLLKNVSRDQECNYCHMGVSGLSKYRLYAFEDLGVSVKGEHSLGSTQVPDSNLVGQSNRVVSPDAETGELFSRGGPYDDNGKQQLDCFACHSVHGANTITDPLAGGWTRRILRANPGASPGAFDANNGLSGANAAALGFTGLMQTDAASVDSRMLTPVKNLSTIRGVFCGSCHNRNFNFRENETNGVDFSLQKASHPMGTDGTLDVGGGAGVSGLAKVSWQNVAWCGSCHAAPVELGGVTPDAGSGYAGQLGDDQNANIADVEDWGTRWYAAGFPHQSESNKLLFESYTAGNRDATQTNDALESVSEMDAVCGKCHTASQDFSGDDGVGLSF